LAHHDFKTGGFSTTRSGLAVKPMLAKQGRAAFRQLMMGILWVLLFQGALAGRFGQFRSLHDLLFAPERIFNVGINGAVL
jgi:hypothetical protein